MPISTASICPETMRDAAAAGMSRVDLDAMALADGTDVCTDGAVLGSTTSLTFETVKNRLPMPDVPLTPVPVASQKIVNRDGRF
jgi:hypothetical protein